jgi:lipoprotein-releasing system ATP-binding protein
MMINAVNIEKSFSLRTDKVIKVLKNCSVEINKAEFLAIMGPSGAGKSTLLHILGSVDVPDTGDIIYCIDKEISLSKLNNKKIAEFRNNNIGFIFQQFHLLPEFTAIENVLMPALIMGIPFGEAKKRAFRLIEKVGLSNRIEHKPSELSGGESQRIAIARAMINSPSVIFADEPTGNLDFENSKIILDLLEEIKLENNITLVMATHSNDVAQRADRIIRIVDGQVIE